jgi:serine/threonine protein phosphatase PrpC
MVEDAMIADVLSESNSAQTACQNLLDLALAGGGVDNITAVLANFVSPEQT